MGFIHIENAVMQRLKYKDNVCADDLHSLYRHIKEKRIFGMVFKSLLVKKKIKAVAWKNSERQECHHRAIMVYELNG